MKSRLLFWIVLSFTGVPVFAHQAAETKPALISTGGLPVFFSSEGPMSYASLTQHEIPKDAEPVGEVTGHSCQFSLAVPISATLHSSSLSGAMGNGTYAKILREIAQSHPGLRGIYDVKVDLHHISILGIFGKLCTELTAQGYR